MAKREGLSVVWLESFVQVAESGKRMAAAAATGVEQGTVTKDIQKLERWLGRGPRMLLLDNGVPARLMPDGERFLPVAKQILALLDEARAPLVPIEVPPETRASVKNLTVPARNTPPKDG